MLRSCTDGLMAQKTESVRCVKPRHCCSNDAVMLKMLLNVGRGAEDMKPLQSHADGSQLTIHSLQTSL